MPLRKEGAKDLKDFRLINLMEGPYKFLVEVLVNRLKKVVRKVASAFQHVFVEGHQILDAVIM